jgi:hypothetical protein
MRSLLAVCLVILGACAAARAQAACTMTLAQSPVVNGLRLGMTRDEVLALFPGIRADKEVSAELSQPANTLGVSGLSIRPDRYASKAKFAGVSQITLQMLDGRVTNMHVGYNGPEWKHVDDFLAKFVEGKKLPAPHAWEPYVGMDTQLKILKCKGFEVSVFAGGKSVHNINYVQMVDLEARQKLKERRDKAKGANFISKPWTM